MLAQVTSDLEPTSATNFSRAYPLAPNRFASKSQAAVKDATSSESARGPSSPGCRRMRPSTAHSVLRLGHDLYLRRP